VPVDPVALNIPNYHRIIKKPMDFGTIKDNLKNDSYASAKEYHADAKLVFANCFKFNTAEEDVTRMGHQLEAVFDELWTHKDQWMADNAPPSEPATDHEDDDDDESEEEEDDKLSRMQQIQQQIAALSAEALALTSTSAKLPKPVKKKSKSSGGLPKPKRSSSGPSGKSKSSKKKKAQRKMTLAQKRYVSEGISALDETTMRQAVQMIRNGVPSLRVCAPVRKITLTSQDVNDDELELDVDEIPEDVLRNLYDYVKKHRKDGGVEPSEDEYEEAPRRESGATAMPGSGRKKNKPMTAKEQESKIAQVRQQLRRFDGDSSTNDGQ
jgi:bromodomain-containing factor 1